VVSHKQSTRNNFAELKKLTMTNPILHELIVREQSKDRLRQAEQRRLAKAVIVRQPTHRFDLRASLGYLLNAVVYLFKPLARTNKEQFDAAHHDSRPNTVQITIVAGRPRMSARIHEWRDTAIVVYSRPLRGWRAAYYLKSIASRPYSANEGWFGKGLQNTCPVKVTRPKRKR
jgi:hypothetical protein